MVKKHKKLILITIIVLLLIFGLILLRYQNTSSKRLVNKYSKEIAQFHSSTDKDNDGIDDEVDILDSALEYISQKPKYKSKYYSTGYPDDEYGTCVDVVGYALKNAGYDLQKLVEDDVIKYPKEYDISVVDANIDFRRVKNLKIYFKHNAISLTTDINDIEEWQGGDIVIFTNHIGIVSDRRNSKGITYVIHHSNPWQLRYEEDILEKRDDIVGHYRISKRSMRSFYLCIAI